MKPFTSFAVGIYDPETGETERIIAMTDDPGPIEDDLNDETKQDNSPDLPSPLEGNEDEDDTPDNPDVKQDGRTG